MLGIISLIFLLLSFAPLYFIVLMLVNNAYESGLQAIFFGAPFFLLLSGAFLFSLIDVVWKRNSSLSKIVLGLSSTLLAVMFVMMMI